MEADFLDVEDRLVIELDGAQHLGDRDAYRRDRQKDRLLQENGYQVLRFLAEDIGARLDEILDEILRTMAHRSKRRPSPSAAHQGEFSNLS
jgi:very-short-patch-repair endonuclease